MFRSEFMQNSRSWQPTPPTQTHVALCHTQLRGPTASPRVSKPHATGRKLLLES